jgi:hypothetical protein
MTAAIFPLAELYQGRRVLRALPGGREPDLRVLALPINGPISRACSSVASDPPTCKCRLPGIRERLQAAAGRRAGRSKNQVVRVPVASDVVPRVVGDVAGAERA